MLLCSIRVKFKGGDAMYGTHSGTNKFSRVAVTINLLSEENTFVKKVSIFPGINVKIIKK